VNLKVKIVLLSIVPVLAALLIISFFVYSQANQLVEQQVAAVEKQILEEKKNEILQYIELAKTSIEPFIDSDNPENRSQSEENVKRIIKNLTYGSDGYFFIYDYFGVNIVHPKQPWRAGENWWHIKDANGTYVIRDLVDVARDGGGFVSYLWARPSTGEVSKKLSYGLAIEEFGWMLGTGLYTDEISATVQELRNDVAARVNKIFSLIAAIFFASIIGVVSIISLLAYRETSFADRKLRELNNRILNIQELERARVSRELHDSISQILVSAKYEMSFAQSKIQKRHPDEIVELDESFHRIDDAIQEVRRISAGLRPIVLDDLGLSAALRSLGERFVQSTGIETRVDVTPVEGSAQEDGAGILNMKERMAHFSGKLSIHSNSKGTELIAEMPFGQEARSSDVRRYG